MDMSRFDRKFRAVMAGRGFRVSEWRESIMQFERFRARNAVSDAKQSGIWANKFEDRSRECKVLANGARLNADIEVMPLSARLRCFKNLHLDGGSRLIDRRFDELPRGLCQLSDMLECELPEPDLLTL
jgi:hypothetical protein